MTTTELKKRMIIDFEDLVVEVSGPMEDRQLFLEETRLVVGTEACRKVAPRGRPSRSLERAAGGMGPPNEISGSLNAYDDLVSR